jgi:hypothetical protein
MEHMANRVSWTVVVLLSVSLVVTAGVAAADPPEEKGGWEAGSAYNQLYQVSELETFRAQVVKVMEVTPMPGMSPGVALQVEEDEGEAVEVHVCPNWYMDAGSIGLRRGDKVKIRGVWAEIEGRDVFMAAKIKKGDYFVLKVRLTKDGTPFWTMSPEQLAMEKQDTN